MATMIEHSSWARQELVPMWPHQDELQMQTLEFAALQQVNSEADEDAVELNNPHHLHHQQLHMASIVPCPPPMPTPDELSPVNTTPSSPNTVNSDASPEQSAPGSPYQEKDAESIAEEDGNYSESEEKPRKRRGRKRKVGTDDPDELKAIHNANEKKRRADQRRLFSQLRKVVPGVEEQAQKTVVLQRVYEYLKQQEHTIDAQRKKLLQYEAQLGIVHEKALPVAKSSSPSARAARGARRSSVA